MIDEAVQTAKQSDVVVAVVGEAQGHGPRSLQPDRYHYSAKPARPDCRALKATGKPLVLVLMNGPSAGAA